MNQEKEREVEQFAEENYRKFIVIRDSPERRMRQVLISVRLKYVAYGIDRCRAIAKKHIEKLLLVGAL
jgi:hypothetical protein